MLFIQTKLCSISPTKWCEQPIKVRTTFCMTDYVCGSCWTRYRICYTEVKNNIVQTPQTRLDYLFYPSA